MAGRPTPASGAPASLRVEVLKELQALIDNRDLRDRIDRGPLAETRGKEHWILHLLLRAAEIDQVHLDTLIGTSYSNTIARLQAIEDRLQRVEATGQGLGEEIRTRFDGMEGVLVERLSKEISEGVDRAAAKVGADMFTNLDQKWKPVGESIEAFAQSSHQLTKDLSDTYRVATQSRLLLNENARRIIDLGRDLVALEESLKLALTKVLQDALEPLEERIAALEGRLGAAEEANGARATSDPPGGT